MAINGPAARSRPPGRGRPVAAARPGSRERCQGGTARPAAGAGTGALRPPVPDLQDVAVAAVHPVRVVHRGTDGEPRAEFRAGAARDRDRQHHRRPGRGGPVHPGAAHRHGPDAAVPGRVPQVGRAARRGQLGVRHRLGRLQQRVRRARRARDDRDLPGHGGCGHRERLRRVAVPAGGGITVRRPAIALINSAAAFGFSAWFLYVPGALYDKVENLLLFFTYWISAWLGVVVVDWVRRRGRVCVAELRDFGKLRWSALALIAFVAGSPPRSHSPTPPPGMTSPPATRRSRTWPATSRSARCTRPTSGTFSRSRSPRCCTGRCSAAPPRHANPGNPAVTAAPAGGKPDGQPGRDAREGGAKVHDRTGLRPLPPGRPGCATAGLPSTEVDCLPAHAEMTIVRWVCWSETSGLWIRSFQELVVPSAAVISWTASASAGLTLCPSSLCAAATLLASARTKCR